MTTLGSSDRRDIEELRSRFWAFHGALKQPLTELGLERATVKTGGEFCETSLTSKMNAFDDRKQTQSTDNIG
ncbi:hypothetical protein EAG_02616 [Camponotus floridanus]|uniref:Uncharacterized protein n=1 Tax=Camponotus floridanus TaxID=104421 RepID=E2AYC8_CAMFO|nr:hypothetical protein EAG_02616 [Camponotus floridanus]